MIHRMISTVSFSIARGTRSAVLLLIILVSGLGGCVDCEKRFCRGVRVSSVQLMSIADRCCLEPELAGCEDPERFFQMILERLMLAYDACHENNFERMVDILDELLRMLPFFSLSAVCDEHLALDDSLRDWLEERCELFRNEGAFFGPEDTIAVTAGLSLDELPSAYSPRQVFHPFQSGSTVAFDAWFASGKTTLEGGLTLGGHRPLPGGGRIIPIHDACVEFGFAPSRGTYRIRSTVLSRFDRSVAGWIVLDELGVGRLGLQLCLETPDSTAHGPMWFECPVSLVRGMLRIESLESREALEHFPVDDSVRELFDIVIGGFDDVSSSQDDVFDPCERVDGLSRRALGWLQRLRMIFPDCFPAAEASGRSVGG